MDIYNGNHIGNATVSGSFGTDATQSLFIGQFTGSFTGSLQGTASNATSAATASYFAGAIVSSSHAQTASVVLEKGVLGGEPGEVFQWDYVTNVSRFLPNLYYSANKISYEISTGTIYDLNGSASIEGNGRHLIGPDGTFKALEWDTQNGHARLYGSASNALTSSFALRSDTTRLADTASYFAGTITTASHAITATTASHAVIAALANNATSASNALFSIFSNYALSSSQAITADTLDGFHHYDFAKTGSNHYNGTQTITGSLVVTGNITGSFTGSLFGSASHAVTAATASYFIGSVESASHALRSNTTILAETASYFAGSIQSASYAVTSSHAIFGATSSYQLNYGDMYDVVSQFTDIDLFKVGPVGGDPDLVTGVNAPTDAQINGTVMLVKHPKTLSGFTYYIGTAGIFTADNYNGLGLYKYDTNTGTASLVASCSNLSGGAVWKGGNNRWYTESFVTPYDAEPGIYYSAILYNNSGQTTQPQVGIITTYQNSGINTIPGIRFGAKLSWVLSAQTDLPQTVVLSATTGTTIRRAVYCW